jgi:hypothetical protein
MLGLRSHLTLVWDRVNHIEWRGGGNISHDMHISTDGVKPHVSQQLLKIVINKKQYGYIGIVLY